MKKRGKNYMKLKRIAALAMSAMMTLGMCTTAFAAEPTVANGDYTGTIHFHNASSPENYSMCDSIFAHTADVELTDEAANLTFYVAYPIPAFADQGTDGTIKNVKMTVGETQYEGVSDIETKAVKTFDTAGALFGINAGDELPTQSVTVELPREAADSFESGIKTDAYVNVVMNTDVEFVVKVTDLTAVNNGAESDADTKSMEITANVEEVVSEPSYTVTVPESVAFGKLSADKFNSVNYQVSVKAADLNGTLKVEAPENGELTSGSNALAFTNNFGAQTVTADTEGTTMNGTLSVAPSAVKAAVAGNYTGTTTFTISYTAK